MNGAHISKGILADICNHCKRCNGLLLHPALAPRLEHRKETLDNRVEIWQKDLPLHALAHVNERRGRVGMYPAREKFRQGGLRKKSPKCLASGACSAGMSTVKISW